MKSYEELKQWRKQYIHSVSWDHQKLNSFHDELMKKTVQIALEKVEGEWGHPPTHFAFFVMGSAGREEQSVWSDQDHGIVYDHSTKECQEYFLKLGEEITDGLALVGYERCEGNVMASNPFWCKSLSEWKTQINIWFDKADWESLRYFSTFFDSRALYGDDNLVDKIKVYAMKKLDEQPFLYKRMYENVGFIKKGIGIFGQLLPEQKGEDAGCINLKQTIFFPFVNSLRLLALMEKITSSPTLERFQQLPEHFHSLKTYQADFMKLLNYRLYFQKEATNYKKVHLLNIKALSTNERKELKKMMKKGYKLFAITKDIIEKRCSR
ncbi:hypothetical protein BKP37_04485 [Anaerobacillus alkalilacustris]|uniref:CBS domain-containing protein n=1 Tax=Anaerobacillus alkalilacustris TaxID=393763 RepID=A0A1S2LX84_9BACI|nr:DUF294 nucleotidyltransferase-like domain-containing protein [Anaerobacillus alkalilacustris]OIJ16793.1 hypothetical protein BKP37_04485 [Anaerobacillus alkalilacustris]